MTRAPNSRSTLSTKNGTPMICATRRASSAASGEQQLRDCSYPSGMSPWVRIHTPMTSSPLVGASRASSAAATLESTPPLMAATIRLMPAPPRAPRCGAAARTRR
jgi:hypothetical protein